jgi:uncharacterized Zn-finger protein
MTEIYKKTKNHNTNYYRRNKVTRFNVKTCPQCCYETTGPKSCIQAHIWAKHTPENERPFQCPCSQCEKGFSARANLNKHILKKHNIVMPKKINQKVLVYKIEPIANNLTQYNDNLYIAADQLPIVCNNKLITYNTLHYDKGNNLINLISFTRQDLLNLNNNYIVEEQKEH